jgi:hypothetical protein
MYSRWLYTERIPIDEDNNTAYSDLFKAWHFGRLVKDNNFLLAVLRATLELKGDAKTYPGFQVISLLYQWTTANCRLRKIMVGGYALEKRSGPIETHWRQYPVEFMKDVIVALMSAKDRSELTTRLYAMLEAEGDYF